MIVHRARFTHTLTFENINFKVLSNPRRAHLTTIRINIFLLFSSIVVVVVVNVCLLSTRKARARPRIKRLRTRDQERRDSLGDKNEHAWLRGAPPVGTAHCYAATRASIQNIARPTVCIVAYIVSKYTYEYIQPYTLYLVIYLVSYRQATQFLLLAFILIVKRA